MLPPLRTLTSCPGSVAWIRDNGVLSPIPGCYNHHNIITHPVGRGCKADIVNYDPRTGAPRDVVPDLERSITGWAPGTDEKARTRSKDQEAIRRVANSKLIPPGKVAPLQGAWLGRLGVSLFEPHKSGGAADLNEIEQTGWIPLPRKLVVDSGAGETVIPKGWLLAHPVKESPGSMANDFYTTADGSKVYNEGQKELLLATPDGKSMRKMTFQFAKVSKALGSVSQMVDHGNRIVFDTDAQGRDISYIENKKTKERIWLQRENGVYVLDMVVAPPSSNDSKNKPVFSRNKQHAIQ